MALAHQLSPLLVSCLSNSGNVCEFLNMFTIWPSFLDEQIISETDDTETTRVAARAHA